MKNVKTMAMTLALVAGITGTAFAADIREIVGDPGTEITDRTPPATRPGYLMATPWNPTWKMMWPLPNGHVGTHQCRIANYGPSSNPMGQLAAALNW